jgi:hypothetical protein
MATEIRPGVFGALFGRLAAKSEAAGPMMLTPLALAIERQAKLNLGQSSHPYGTPTPAFAGGPPAMISGTGRRSITHTRPTPTGGGWESRVGVATGFYPPYGRGKRTPSSKYLYYLETGNTRNGAAYPFLIPAFDTVVHSTSSAAIARWIAIDWH